MDEIGLSLTVVVFLIVVLTIEFKELITKLVLFSSVILIFSTTFVTVEVKDVITVAVVIT